VCFVYGHTRFVNIVVLVAGREGLSAALRLTACFKFQSIMTPSLCYTHCSMLATKLQWMFYELPSLLHPLMVTCGRDAVSEWLPTRTVDELRAAGWNGQLG
jgi:hypothetical protein